MGEQLTSAQQHILPNCLPCSALCSLLPPALPALAGGHQHGTHPRAGPCGGGGPAHHSLPDARQRADSGEGQGSDLLAQAPAAQLALAAAGASNLMCVPSQCFLCFPAVSHYNCKRTASCMCLEIKTAVAGRHSSAARRWRGVARLAPSGCQDFCQPLPLAVPAPQGCVQPCRPYPKGPSAWRLCTPRTWAGLCLPSKTAKNRFSRSSVIITDRQRLFQVLRPHAVSQPGLPSSHPIATLVQLLFSAAVGPEGAARSL